MENSCKTQIYSECIQTAPNTAKYMYLDMQQIPISAANKNNCPSPSSQACHCNRIMLPYTKTFNDKNKNPPLQYLCYNIAHLIWFQIKVFPPSNNLKLGPINYNILSHIVSFSFLSLSTISVLKKRQARQSQCSLLYSSTTGVINLKTTKSRHTFTFQQKTFILQ